MLEDRDRIRGIVLGKIKEEGKEGNKEGWERECEDEGRQKRRRGICR